MILREGLAGDLTRLVAQRPNEGNLLVRCNAVILSDHYYDPYSFAGSAETHAWGTGNSGIDSWGQEDWVQTQVAKLKSNFIDKGLPMIWGEYGGAWAVTAKGSGVALCTIAAAFVAGVASPFPILRNLPEAGAGWPRVVHSGMT